MNIRCFLSRWVEIPPRLVKLMCAWYVSINYTFNFSDFPEAYKEPLFTYNCYHLPPDFVKTYGTVSLGWSLITGKFNENILQH